MACKSPENLGFECVYQMQSTYYLGQPLCAYCGGPILDVEETQDLVPDDFKSAMQFRWK